MKLFYHRCSTLRIGRAGYSVFMPSNKGAETSRNANGLQASRKTLTHDSGIVSPGKSAYAVHRGDACQFKFCFKLAETLSFHVLENSGELEVSGGGEGRDPCRTQSLRQDKPPSAMYVGRQKVSGIMQPSHRDTERLGIEDWLSPRCPVGRSVNEAEGSSNDGRAWSLAECRFG